MYPYELAAGVVEFAPFHSAANGACDSSGSSSWTADCTANTFAVYAAAGCAQGSSVVASGSMDQCVNGVVDGNPELSFRATCGSGTAALTVFTGTNCAGLTENLGVNPSGL
ncbi:MAG: hypothetical protein EOO65_05025 [Methanosarcinales archaeon]|nr:MAG: hypothetical protein EOO65_05025 [Methanosarcinales archaeon]